MADTTRETMTIKATGNSSAAPSTNNGEEAAKPSRQKKEDGGRIVKDKELICQQDMVDLMAELPDDATRSRVGLWFMQRFSSIVFTGAMGSIRVSVEDK